MAKSHKSAAHDSAVPSDRVTKALREAFDVADRAGRQALKRHDFDALDQAIRVERDLIARQQVEVERARALVNRRKAR